MKSKLLLIIIFLFAFIGMKSQASLIKTDPIITDSLFVADTAWTFRFYDGISHRQTRSAYSYDSWGNMIDNVYQGWDIDSNNYFNSERWTQKYNSKGQMLEAFSYGFKTDWFYKEKEYYSYNDKGLLTDENGYMWDGTQWVTYSNWTHKYNENNKEIETVYLFWKYDKWKKVNKKEYIYYSDKKLKEEITYNSNDSDEWVPNQWVLWDYYRDTVQMRSVMMMYDQWTLTEKNEFIYNKKGLLISREDFYSSMNWEPYSKTSYEYNSDGKKTRALTEYWDIPQKHYLTFEVRYYIYDENGKILKEERYNRSGDTLGLYYYIIYKNKKIFTDLVEKNISSESLECKIYPNPASDYIIIQNVIPAKAGIYVEIYNIFGESVSITSSDLSPALSEGEGAKIKIDISNLPPGIYFIKIGDKFEKFVKM